MSPISEKSQVTNTVCREAGDLFTDDKSPIYGNLFVIIHNIHTILRIRHTHVHGHIMGLHVFI